MTSLEIVLLVILVCSWLLVVSFLLYKFSRKDKNFKENKDAIKEILETGFDEEPPSKLKNKKEVNKALKKLAQSSALPKLKINLDLKVVSVEIESNVAKGERNIAYVSFVLIITSVLANDAEKGKIQEAIDSIFSVFKKIQNLLLETRNPNIASMLLIFVLNKYLRPILNASREIMDVDSNGKNKLKSQGKIPDISKLEEDLWEKIKEARKKLMKNNILRLLSLFGNLAYTNKEISEIMNFNKSEKIKNSLDKGSDEIIVSTEKEIKSEIDQKNVAKQTFQE